MSKNAQKRTSALTGLSARLLVLTVFFVMLSEFLIWAPSVSRYRKVYLEQHVDTAHLAMLALAATPDGMVSEKMEDQLLAHADAYGVALKRPGWKLLMLSTKMPDKIDLTIDLSKDHYMRWMMDAFDTMIQDENRILRVMGTSSRDPTVVVEVVLDETPMREAMYAYSGRIMQLSIVISLITAGLVYLSLQWLLVRPMRRITRSMTAFNDNPENESTTIAPTSRRDEIGVAQRALAAMQTQIRTALRQKTRLATLGAAVAKINHDLRNSLATAVLVSDRLADIDDPEVQKVTPRLYTAIDRAVNLCSQTLNYVGNDLPSLQPSRFRLHDLVSEVGTALGVLGGEMEGAVGGAVEGKNGSMDWLVQMSPDLEVIADREQLFRVLSNLGLNAVEAGARSLRVVAHNTEGKILIEVVDDGPGLPNRAQKRLFEPFAGSVREGGTGLGLVIARDIMRAHGGDIILKSTGNEGTTFCLELPVRHDV